MTRIFLDGGSDSSYIRSSLAEELGLPVTGTGTFSCIGFQERTEEPRQYDQVRVKLSSRFGDGHVTVDLWSTDRVCSPLPVPSLTNMPSEMPELMADDFKGGEVDILIGIDNLYHIVLWEQMEMGDGLRAVNTVFGYVMHGRLTSSDVCIGLPCHRSNHRCMLEKLRDLETVGITEELLEQDPAEACLPVWNEGGKKKEEKAAKKRGRRSWNVGVDDDVGDGNGVDMDFGGEVSIGRNRKAEGDSVGKAERGQETASKRKVVRPRKTRPEREEALALSEPSGAKEENPEVVEVKDDECDEREATQKARSTHGRRARGKRRRNWPDRVQVFGLLAVLRAAISCSSDVSDVTIAFTIWFSVTLHIVRCWERMVGVTIEILYT